MNYKKLKAKMVLEGKNASDIVRELDKRYSIKMDRSTFYRKVNGASEFDRKEIIGIAKILFMTDTDIVDIFFSEKVS